MSLTLTKTEEQIVKVLVMTGSSNKDIGEMLGIGEGTVRTHLRNIFKKLGVKSRGELIAKNKD